MRTLYFHGMPGSPEELSLFDGIDTSSWIAPNRGELPPGATQSERFDLLAGLVREQCRAGPVRLVGFSLGAYVALETARRVHDETLTLDLISAAARLLNVDRFLSEWPVVAYLRWRGTGPSSGKEAGVDRADEGADHESWPLSGTEELAQDADPDRAKAAAPAKTKAVRLRPNAVGLLRMGGRSVARSAFSNSSRLVDKAVSDSEVFWLRYACAEWRLTGLVQRAARAWRLLP